MRAIVAFVGTTIAVLTVSVAPAAGQSAPAPAQSTTNTPAPDPTPTPGTKPPRLRLDLDRHVDAVVKRHDDGRPRFEERIEVTAQSEAIEALLRGAELACSASPNGPPTASELNPYKVVPIPPYADFIAAAKAIFKALKRINPWKGEPRYVLYGVRRDDELRFVLREGELPLSQRLAVPGTTWDEIARFHDRGEATTGLRRLERGFDTLARRMPGESPHPSMSVYCLPQTSR